MRHRRAEDDDGIDILVPADTVDPALQARVAIVAQGERLVGKQGVETADLGEARIEAGDVQAAAIAANLLDELLVVRVVDEGPEKNPVLGRQVLEQVVGADLVALVRRVGQAMDEVEDVGHGQPRLRTMCGPSQLARPIGMRRQASMNSLYLALFGLFCGMLSRL